jgi:hypothetical protein
MPNLKDILDAPVPTPKKEKKIRRFYFVFFEIIILMYPICLFILMLLHGIATQDFFVFSMLGLFLYIYLLSISSVFTFINSWSKASSKYDVTFDKGVIYNFLDEIKFYEKDDSSYLLGLILFLMTAFLLVIWERTTFFDVSYWYPCLSLNIYSIVSPLYLFLVRDTVNSILSKEV